jgi:hypothetical protein
VKFGDVPSWVGAVGSVGVLLIALALLRGQRNEIRVGLAEMRANADDRRSEGGRHVTVWVKARDADEPPPDPQLRPCEIVLSNRGPEPVFRVVVTLASRTMTRIPSAAFLSLAPGQTCSVPAWVEEFEGEDAWYSGVQVEFTDSLNRRWLRRFDGRLLPAPNEAMWEMAVERLRGEGHWASAVDHSPPSSAGSSI